MTTGSVYQKTALPAKLDLTKYNTREQLKAAPASQSQNGSGKGAAADSRQDCTDVMRKDLRDWLIKHDIDGPPPNAVAEKKAMWAWIRDFHAEYSEDWFMNNMPRLQDQFKPIFVQEMKAMKAAAAPAPAAAAAADMLDFDAPAPAPAAAAKPAAGSGMDLLDMSEPAPTAPAPSAASSSVAPEPAAAKASGGLLDLDLGGPSTAPPSTSAAAGVPASAGLLDLQFSGADTTKTQTSQPVASAAPADLSGLDFGLSSGYSAPAAAPAPLFQTPGPGVVAAPAPSGLDGLDALGLLADAQPSQTKLPDAQPSQAKPNSSGLDNLLDLM